MSYWNLVDSVSKSFGSGTTVSISSDGGGGSVWKNYVDKYNSDLAALDELSKAFYTKIDMKSMTDFINTRASSAVSSYNQILAALNDGHSGFMADMQNVDALGAIRDSWEDDVWGKIHNASFTALQTKIFDSWYGPGAQAYSTALQTQAGAMDELTKYALNAHDVVAQVYSYVAGITQAIYDASKSLVGDLNSVQVAKNHFAVHIDYGATQFENLASWITDYHDNGPWISALHSKNYDLDGLVQRSTVFAGGHWPKVTTSSLDNMKNGNGGIKVNAQPGQDTKPTDPGLQKPGAPDGSGQKPDNAGKKDDPDKGDRVSADGS